MAKPTKYTKIVFRTRNGVVSGVVDRPARVVRGQITDAMKRFMRSGSPKSLSFRDADTGGTFKVDLASVETWKATSVVSRG